jgi:DNA-binding HxlR family transcriptional regulator
MCPGKVKEDGSIEEHNPTECSKHLLPVRDALEMLIKRTVYDSTPVSVEYELTPYAESLHPVIEALKDWGTQHRTRLMGKSKVPA